MTIIMGKLCSLLKNENRSDPQISLLSIYPKEMDKQLKIIHLPYHIWSSTTIIKQKQAKCPSKDKWLAKLWVTYNVKGNLLVCDNLDGPGIHWDLWNMCKLEYKHCMYSMSLICEKRV
jgi:hypothetical protein